MKLIKQLLEMAKRSNPDQFYSFGKAMYGAEKVKSLSWPEIMAIAQKNDVQIPAYLRSQKVGRGRFNIVPQGHADEKATPTETKPSERANKADLGGMREFDKELTAKVDDLKAKGFELTHRKGNYDSGWVLSYEHKDGRTAILRSTPGNGGKPTIDVTIKGEKKQDVKSEPAAGKKSKMSQEELIAALKKEIPEIGKELEGRYDLDWHVGKGWRDKNSVEVSWSYTYRRNTAAGAYRENTSRIERANERIERLAKTFKDYNPADIHLVNSKTARETDERRESDGDSAYSEYEQSISGGVTFKM